MKDKIRILIVEDSRTQAENIKYFLERYFQVDVASNGKEALKMIAGLKPDIIISDIIMPEMNGFQLCREIKSNIDLKATPFILLTALSDVEDVLKGLECGADHFITKPLNGEHLLSKIRNIAENDGGMHADLNERGIFFYRGKTHVIGSNQYQILNFLLSTYELAIAKNHELEKVQEELEALNRNLEETVEERTSDLARTNEMLRKEIAEHRKAEDTLQRSREQLRILASRILTAQEDERKKIAFDIHDVLGSALSAIKFKVEAILYGIDRSDKIGISQSLEELVPFIQDTMEETRRIQADLRPPLLDRIGVIAAFSWFCRRFETIYLQIHVDQEVLVQEQEVPDYLKTALFRIAQEAMNNIGKHSGARHVHLGLRKINNAIELTIEDNGKGFDKSRLLAGNGPKRGLGLSSMKERAEFLEGLFSIDSIEGKGTTIKAVLPIKSDPVT